MVAGVKIVSADWANLRKVWLTRRLFAGDACRPFVRVLDSVPGFLTLEIIRMAAQKNDQNSAPTPGQILARIRWEKDTRSPAERSAQAREAVAARNKKLTPRRRREIAGIASAAAAKARKKLAVEAKRSTATNSTVAKRGKSKKILAS